MPCFGHISRRSIRPLTMITLRTYGNCSSGSLTLRSSSLRMMTRVTSGLSERTRSSRLVTSLASSSSTRECAFEAQKMRSTIA